MPIETSKHDLAMEIFALKDEIDRLEKLKVTHAEMLAMLKVVNYALYVIGKPSAVKSAMQGSKELIRRAETV